MIDLEYEQIQLIKQQPGTRKNVRISFPNGERSDILNENVEYESLSFTESICSSSPIKFGKNEKAVVQFTTREVEDIQGCEIDVELDVDMRKLLWSKGVSEDGSTTVHEYQHLKRKTVNGKTIKLTGVFSIEEGLTIECSSNMESITFKMNGEPDVVISNAGKIYTLNQEKINQIEEEYDDPWAWNSILIQTAGEDQDAVCYMITDYKDDVVIRDNIEYLPRHDDTEHSIQLMMDEVRDAGITFEFTEPVMMLICTGEDKSDYAQYTGIGSKWTLTERHLLNWNIQTRKKGFSEKVLRSITIVYADKKPDVWIYRSNVVQKQDRIQGIESSYDVPYPYVRVPYGRFKIESCEKDETAYERRKVVAYRVVDASQGSDWSEVQKKKTTMRTQWDDAMELDILKAIYDSADVEHIGTDTLREIDPTATKIDGGTRIVSIENSTRDIYQVYVGIKYQEFDFWGDTLWNIKYDNIFETDSELYDSITANINAKLYESKPMSDIRAAVEDNLKNKNLRKIIVELGTDRKGKTIEAVCESGEVYNGIHVSNGSDIEEDYFDELYKNVKIKVPVSYYITIDTNDRDLWWGSSTEYKIKNNIKTYLEENNYFNMFYLQLSKNKRKGGYRVTESLPDFKKYFEGYAELLGKMIKNSRDGKAVLMNIGDSKEYLTMRDIRKLKISKKDTVSVELNASTTDGERITYTSQLKGNKTYRLNDNVIMSSLNPLWDETDSEGQKLQKFVDDYAKKIEKMKYVPFTMTCVGMPYIEAGDRIYIHTDSGDIEPIIMRRTITGIQNLVDYMEAL